ncbi:DEAD/DEAH box helicase [Salinimicrobium flavum]|uniref:DEAD/DEAH box helicase n=1 Tax=Salinimicrobium flavum TaxID=1737065 RepID=A0ABW5IZ58_9FLAO
MSFKNLNLIPSILKALDAQGYTTPTPIQKQAIPVVLEKRDLLGVAQTGTGKTAAFGIPILQLLDGKKHSGKGVKALILTPTRELAIQIDESLAAYGKYINLTHSVIFGGVSQVNQVQKLKRGVDILVATPGRLLDLMNQGHVDLRTLEIFVLDEADRMLDMGFIHDVKKVIKSIPEKRQTLFFSATMPEEIQGLANMMLKNPVKIEVTPPSSTVDKIEQRVYFTNKPDKRKLLLHLLETNGIENALVFTRTKHGADKVARFLDKARISSAAIHGNKSQNARQNALKNFKNGNLNVLVATDIAARGIDIDELTHVFNFDLPNVPETYVHRIGRTGRAGNDGIAISFCAAEERKELKDIEKLAAIKIPVIEGHPFPMDLNAAPVAAAPAQNRNRNNRQGRRR